MKNSLLLLLMFSLFAFSHGYGQEKELCKSWKTDFYIAGGKKQLPNAEEKKNKMTFNSDYTFEGVEEGVAITGLWKFDAKKKKITLKINDFPVNLEMKIITLTENSFVWEARNADDGSFKKTYMVPLTP